MQFLDANGAARPVRLCEETRSFAMDSLNRKYGLMTKTVPAVQMDDIPQFESLSRYERYDLIISRIVREAPLRICEGELISGAATLGLAVEHCIPATRGGKHVFGGISHLTVDFETVLRYGVDHIRKTAVESLEKHRGTAREPFLKSCIATLDALAFWHNRYLEALRDRAMHDNYLALSRVPFAPASSFREAVQSLWFTFAFLRLCGNWPGIGRIDFLLGDYLKADLRAGKLTLDEAREILAHFFIKGCEWICGNNTFSKGSGDAQHYQNIVLAGIDRDGKEITNEVTYLVLDILEELPIGDFPTTVRVNKNTEERLLHRVAEVIQRGGGVLAIYNEDLVLEALRRHGYEEREARSFANDGCWEVQIPGKTFFCYIPFDALRLLQQGVLKDYAEGIDFESFEALYASYVRCLGESVEEILQKQCAVFRDGVPSHTWKDRTPCTAVSLFEQGCIEKGLSYLEGGPVYNVCSPHIGGLPDAANSLYAIRKLVYEEKLLTLPELLAILRNDWEGEETLRRHVLNAYTYYGNDNDEVDLLVARILSDFAEACRTLSGRCGYCFPPGVSTFGRQLEWAPHRLATPSGKHKNTVLAPNLSPTPGTDGAGATAVIRSHCKADLAAMTTGAALDLKLLPKSVAGDTGINTLVALIRGFVSLGGFFMQPDVVDASILRAAQEHPEEYNTLSVRVSGWNARFVTLDRSWQDMLIHQTEH